MESGERSTRTCRGAHYIGYDKRVDAPWSIVLSAFVSSRIPHQCTCERISWVASTRRRVPLRVKVCTQLGALRYASPDSRVRGPASIPCNERRVTTPSAAVWGRPQGAHTGVDHAGSTAHSVTVATGPTCDARNSRVVSDQQNASWLPQLASTAVKQFESPAEVVS